MYDYFASNWSFDNSNNYDGGGVNLQTRVYTGAADKSPTYANGRCYANFEIDSQSRFINENGQKLLTWTISLIDDQDILSIQFLKMQNEFQTATEKFGPAILSVPENIRIQADELFNHSISNFNEIFDLVNDKVSWILLSSYQQYLKSIPQNVMDKKEKPTLYPWIQWSALTDVQQHRPSPNNVVTVLDRSSSSSPYAYGGFSNSSNNNNNSSNNSIYGGFSNHNISNSSIYGGFSNKNISNSSVYNNTSNNNSFSYCGAGGDGDGVMVADTSPASDANVKPVNPYWTSSPTRQRFAANNGRGDGHQRLSMQQHQMARTPSDSGRSASSIDMHDDRSPPPMAAGPTTAPSNSCWPSRLYYCVNTENTVNKLVEHYCTFCYKNHEPPEVYGTHLVRDSTRTTCPKLRALKCKHCNSTGDNAHTIKYCPFLYSNYC